MSDDDEAAPLFDRMTQWMGDRPPGEWVDPPGMFYDRAGNPMTMAEWAARNYRDEERRIALATVAGVRISTVWLGINHNFLMLGPPIIFETMTFGPPPFDGLQWRYSTEAAALAWHDQVVHTVRDWARGRISADAALRRLDA